MTRILLVGATSLVAALKIAEYLNLCCCIYWHFGLVFQSKHPHIIYESSEKPRQLCGVLDNQLRSSNNRRNRRSAGDMEHHHHHQQLNLQHLIKDKSEEQRGKFVSSDTRTRYNSTRDRRDVRFVPKFVETALVLDKAMVREIFYWSKDTRK